MTQVGGTCVVAIDYSMSCPCVGWFDTSGSRDFNFSNCNFQIQHNKKLKKTPLPNHIEYIRLPNKFDSPEQRWGMISSNIIQGTACAVPKRVVALGLEDYSYSAQSNNMFNVGEHTGVLKHKLFCSGIVITTVGISQWKKNSGAEGGGNASKGQLLKRFKEIDPKGYEIISSSFDIKITVSKIINDLK